MDRKKINILIAEDDPDLLRITQKLISSKYDSVYTATTGATCLEIALQIKPDLLLLDVILPDINGIEICRIIKNNPDTAHTYVLLLSSVKTSPDSISEGLEEGADGYIARPVTNRELVARVDSAVRTIMAEHALRKANLRTQALINAVPDIIMEVDENKIYTWTNIAGILFFGEDVIGKEASFYFEGEQNTLEQVEPLFRGSEDTYYVESWQRRKDGAKRLLAWWCRSLKNDSGKTVGAISTARDVTEIRKTETTLLESESKFASSFRLASQAITITRAADGLIHDVNESFCRITGYSHNEAVGKTTIDLNLWEEEADRVSVISGLFQGEKIKDRELFFRSRDGKRIVGLFSCDIIVVQGEKYILSSITDITARKKLEDELREKEEDLLITLNSIGDGVITADSEGIVVRMNPMAEKLCGWKLQEAKGKPLISVFRIINAETRETLNDPVSLVIQKKKAVGLENHTVLIGKDGTEKYISDSAAPIYGSEGKIIGIVLVFSDVSGKYLAQKQITENEKKFRKLWESTNEGVWSMDAASNTTFINRQMANILGYEPEEMIGMKVTLFMDPAELSDNTQRVKNRQAGITERYERRFVTKAGSIVDMLVSVTPLFDDAGDFNGSIAFLTDITERKKAAEALARSNAEILRNNQRLESLVRINHYQAKSVDDMLDFALNEAIQLTQSKIGYIFYYSEEARLFTINAWSKEAMNECKVLSPSRFYKLEDTGCWGEAVRQRRPFIMNDYQQGAPFVKGTPEGHVSLRKFLTVPVLDKEEIVAVVGVANRPEDYTLTDAHQLTLLMNHIWKVVAREKANQELLLAKEKAEQSDRLKSAFLANISHEIRTPMNAIAGFSALLSDPAITPEQRNHYSAIIQSRSDALLRVINDLLDIARIESGNITVVREQVTPAKMILDLESEISGQLKKAGKEHIRLIAEHEPPETGTVIFTDGYIMKQVLSNLLDNSVKYTEQGSIRFGYNPPEEGLISFYVTDTGIGIPREDIPVIFERFRKSTTGYFQKYGGTGLGLAICKGSLAYLGGDIRVESQPGKGSTFTIRIPFESPTVKKQKPVESVIKKGDIQTYSWSGKKILLVEDEETNMEFLRIILKRTGVELISAYSGYEVKKLMDILDSFHLVLMDIRLPDASGWELASDIKAIRPALPVIAQTAYAMSADRQLSESAGCNDYIAKPINKDLLFQIIDKHIL